MELLVFIDAVWVIILMIGIGRIWTHTHAISETNRKILEHLRALAIEVEAQKKGSPIDNRSAEKPVEAVVPLVEHAPDESEVTSTVSAAIYKEEQEAKDKSYTLTVLLFLIVILIIAIAFGVNSVN